MPHQIAQNKGMLLQNIMTMTQRNDTVRGTQFNYACFRRRFCAGISLWSADSALFWWALGSLALRN